MCLVVILAEHGTDKASPCEASWWMEVLTLETSVVVCIMGLRVVYSFLNRNLI